MDRASGCSRCERRAELWEYNSGVELLRDRWELVEMQTRKVNE